MEKAGKEGVQFTRYIFESDLDSDNDLLKRIGCDTFDEMIKNHILPSTADKDENLTQLWNEMVDISNEWARM
jgi:hypothetical protein